MLLVDLRFNTTKSIPPRFPLLQRKLSLITLFIRFLSTARRVYFFDTAKPSLGEAKLVGMQSTVKHSSVVLIGRRKTDRYCAGCKSLLSRGKPAFLTNATDRCYGVSLARPLARRALITLRPLRVAIRARNPWVRARFRVLG